MVSTCPNCGKQIQDETTNFCAWCGKPLRDVAHKKTPLPIVAGTMAIIAAFMCGIGAAQFLEVLDHLFDFCMDPLFQTAGYTCVLGFAFGLTGGVMSLRRKHFALQIEGLIFLMLSGITLAYWGVISVVERALTVCGLAILGLALLSLISTTLSEGEFS